MLKGGEERRGGRGDWRKKKKEGEKVVKGNRQEQANADTRCSYPRLLILLSVLLWRTKTKREERSGGPQGPNRSAPPLYLSLCSLLLSRPFPLSFNPSLCPQQSLYSSVFISPPLPPSFPRSLPPSVSFHVVTHYSTDISPSIPTVSPTVSPLLVLAFTPVSQPGRDRGRGGERVEGEGGGRSRWTDSELQRRGKR